MRYPLFTIMAHLYTILLLPTFHHLWLYAGSGNSNFYYASTLVWALASGLGVLDTLTAALKQKFLHEQRAKGHPALKGTSIEYDTDKWSLVQR
jgi:phosphatidylinositol glycan class U